MNTSHTDTTNIAVCTCQRPQSLKALLESIAGITPPQTTVIVSVIDNDPGKSAEEVYLSLEADFPFPIHYFSEPRRGIPVGVITESGVQEI